MWNVSWLCNKFSHKQRLASEGREREKHAISLAYLLGHRCAGGPCPHHIFDNLYIHFFLAVALSLLACFTLEVGTSLQPLLSYVMTVK